MDERRADEDTLDDVNICIFDYMLCTAIHTAINATGDSTNEWDVTCVEDTTQMLKSILQPSQVLPVSIKIKAQVLDIIKILNSAVRIEPNVLVEMTSMFVSTCNVLSMEAVKRRAAEIAIQLCIHAIFRVYQDSNNGGSEGFMEYYTSLSDEERATKIPEYIVQILPSIGVSIDTLFKLACQTERMNEGGLTTLLRDLTDIMRMLEPPILLQLERGKLEGLSRAETQRLKQEIGLN